MRFLPKAKHLAAAKTLSNAQSYLLRYGWRETEIPCAILSEAERFVRNGFSTKLTWEYFNFESDCWQR